MAQKANTGWESTPEIIHSARGDQKIEIQEASHLFQAEFVRQGPDLVLVNDGEPPIRIIDYFRQAEPADLYSAEGSVLRGEIVEILAGPAFPGQVAQASGAAGSQAIGQVESLTGTAFVQRADGTTEPLSLKTKVFANDVVRTEAGSDLSITFADGTIFSLAASSRMVLNELIYDPAGTENSGVFNLVEGTFVFIAGQVAKTGGMEVITPAATMGIRGTTVKVDIVTVDGITTVEVSLNRDPNGDVGEFQITRLDGSLVANVESTQTKWIVSPVEGETREIPRTSDDLSTDQIALTRAISAFQNATNRVEQGGEYIESSGSDPTQPNPDQAPPEDGGGDEGNEERGDLGSSGIESEVASDTNTGGEGGPDVSITELTGAGGTGSGSSGGTGGAGEGTGGEGSGEGGQGGGSDTATLITNPANDAVDDPPELTLSGAAFSVSEDGSVVLTGFNIDDPDNTILTANLTAGSTITLSPGSGVTILQGTGVQDEFLSIQGTGTQITNALNGLIYNPSPNAENQGTLLVQITDGNSSVSGLMTITITNVQDAPVAIADALVRDETDGLVAGNVLLNDFDFDQTPVPDVIELVSVEQNGNFQALGTSGFATLSLAGGGTLVILSDGTYTFNPGGAYEGLQAGQSLTETITYTITDNQIDPSTGLIHSVDSTLEITILGVDTPFTVSGDQTLDLDEGNQVAITAADLNMVDPDTPDASLLINVTSNPAAGILAFASAPTVPITAFSLADINAGNVIFVSTQETGGIDSFDFEATDGTTTVNGAMTINIGDINDDPSTSALPGPVNATEDTSFDLDLSDLDISDPDAGSAPITITLAPDNGSLTANTASGITITTFGTGGTSLVGTVTALNAYFDVPGNVQFLGAPDAHGLLIDQIDIIANDGGNTGAGGGTDIQLGSIDVNIAAVDDPSIVTTTSGALPYTEGAAGQPVDNGIVITDIDSATLTSAVVKISGNYVQGEDFLSLNSSGGPFTANFSAANGELTLTGSGTLAQLQSELRLVEYENISEVPDTSDRTISFQVFDGTTGSNVGTRTIQLTDQNDDPSASGLPLSATVAEDVSTPLDLSPIMMSDPDIGSATLNVVLKAGTGSLTAIPVISGTFMVTNIGGEVEIEGTLAQINSYLGTGQPVSYLGAPNASGTDSISVTLNDGGSSGAGGGLPVNAGSIQITITPVDDAPTLSGDLSLSAAEETNTTLTLADITAGDIDTTDANLVFEIKTALAEGHVALSSAPATPITTFTQTQLAAGNVVYVHGGGLGISDGFDFTVTDGTTTVNGTMSITINQVNDDPSATGFVTGVLVANQTEDTTANLDLAVLDLIDVDAGTGDLLLTLDAVSGGLIAGSSGGVTVTSIDNTKITLEGSLADLNAYLDGSNIDYAPPPNTNGATADTIAVSISDQGNTGSGGGSSVFLGTVNVDIAAVDDAPVVNHSGATTSFTEGDGPTSLAGSFTLSDIDSSNLTSATVQIASNFDPAHDTLDFTAIGNITGSFNSTNGTLSLMGVDTLANYQTALNSVTFNRTAEDDTAASNRSISVSVNDGTSSSTPATVSLTVAQVNDAPTIDTGSVNLGSDLILNGGFDANNPAGEFTTVNPGDTDIAHWDVVGGNVGFKHGDWQNAEGTGSIDMNGGNASGIMSQTISTEIGQTYVVNFQLAGNPRGGQNSKDVQVSAAGSTANFSFDTSGTSVTDMQWRGETFTFTANSTSTTLTFTSLEPSTNRFGAAIDEVTVFATSALEDEAIAINNLSVGDVDEIGDMEVVLSVSNGTLNVNTGVSGGVPAGMVTGNGSDTVTLVGTAAEINASLADANGVTYLGDANFSGTDTLVISASDGETGQPGGSQSTTQNVSLTVGAVNDAPTIDLSNMTVSENLVENGGFDQNIGPGTFTIVYAGDNTTIPNWTVESGNIDLKHGYFQNHEGAAAIDLNGTASAGSIKTAIETEIGKTYELTFAMAGNHSAELIKDMRVEVGLTSQDFSFDRTGFSFANMGWKEESIFFTATSTQTTIKFSSLEGPDYGGPTLDSVAVREVGTSVTVGEASTVFINNIAVADVDEIGTMTVTLSVTNGNLTVTETAVGGLTSSDISGNGTTTVALTGTAAQINATLAAAKGLGYAGNSGFNGADTLTIAANDNESGIAGGAQTTTSNVSINVTPAPTTVPASTDLGDAMDGTVAGFAGTQFFAPANYESGSEVSGIGDINDDGIEDFAVTAANGVIAGSGLTSPGSTYIIFGKQGADPFSSQEDSNGHALLHNAINSVGGMEIVGSASNVQSGFSVAGIGDINKDGIDDFAIGMPQATNSLIGSNHGSTVVVYGGQNFSTFLNASGEFDIGDVGKSTGPAGFEFANTALNGRFGHSISSQGDVNFDGVDDLLAGGLLSGSNGTPWLIFGGQDFASSVDTNGTLLSTPTLPSGIDGFRMQGENVNDSAGSSVSFIGDFNNDGIDDFAIGSRGNNGGSISGLNTGSVHVIFGGQDFPTLASASSPTFSISLSDVGTTIAGFKLTGEAAGDLAGSEVNKAGDVNGDGIEDFVLTAPRHTDSKLDQGAGYLIFGGQTMAALQSLALVGTTIAGVKFVGANVDDRISNIEYGGDINGDGYADLLISSHNADAGMLSRAGETYVVFGGQSALTGTIDLASIGTSIEGFKLGGEVAGDESGESIAAAGDVNDDGYDDILIGASTNDDENPNGGAGYLIFGDNFTGDVTHQGTSAADTQTGTSGRDVMIGAGGDDTLIGNGGMDTLKAGSGNDAVTVGDLAFLQVDGGAGQDTLSFDMTGLIDLRNINNARISGFEVLDIKDGKANSLSVSIDDVFAMNGDGNAVLETALSVQLPNSVLIDTDTGETVELDGTTTGSWVKNVSASSTVSGYDVFEYSHTGSLDVLATVGVDENANVVIA